MVPQCSCLSSMFASHGATVWLARCHVLLAMAPQYLVNVAMLLVLVLQVIGHSPMSSGRGPQFVMANVVFLSAMAPLYIAFNIPRHSGPQEG